MQKSRPMGGFFMMAGWQLVVPPVSVGADIDVLVLLADLEELLEVG